jgi:DNA-binding transcriptional LysR family regulator
VKHDLNLIRVLVAIAEAGNVGIASHALGMTQPGVSNALRRLRATYMDTLFVRTGRGMEATPRAVALIEAGREILRLHETKMLGLTPFVPATTETEFRLAMSDIGEMVFLPKILEHCRLHAPRATFRAVNLVPRALGEALECGNVDLAVGYFPDLVGGASFQQKLFSHGFVCLARLGHPDIGKRLSRSEFLALGHAVVRAEGRSQEVFEQYLRNQRIERRVVLNVPHYMSIPLVIAKSDLIVTVPLAVGTSFATLARLRLLKPPFDIPWFDIKQHWHRRVHRDARNRWLRAQIGVLFKGAVNEWREPDWS